MPSKKFERLKAQWYRKLAKSGFEDIEDDKGQLRKDTSKRRMQSRDRSEIEALAEYYRRAEHWLLERPTPWDPRHRDIWALHSEGLSYGVISKRLNIKIFDVRKVVEAI